MKTTIQRCLKIISVFGVVLLGSRAVLQAAEEPALVAQPAKESRYLPWEKGSLKFGGFVAAFDSTLGFGLNHAAGVTLNAEELLGLDTSLTVFRVDAMYRPGKSLRHQLDLSYASYHRDGSATLNEEIEINNITFPVGARVETVFNFDIIRGDYTYAILQDERMRIALGLGVYAVPLRFSVEGETTGGRRRVEGADTTLPLPALALRGEFQLIPRLFLNTYMDAMYLEISDFQGSLLDVNISLEYRPWNHFGFGVGYNSMSVDVEAQDKSSHYPGADFVGTVGVRFSGLMLYGKWSF